MQLVAHERSPYGELRVFDTTELYGELGRFRVLQFADGAVQGAIDLRDPARIVLPYQRAIVHLMETIRPSFGRAFVIGHGAGTIAGRYPEERTETAEIDAAVVELSRAYFGYTLNNVAIGDGRELLSRTEPRSFDYVVADAFTADGTPPQLATIEFFELARDKLRPGGAILVNVIGRGGRDKRISSMLSTLQAVFPYAEALVGTEGEAGEGANLILVAGPSEIAGSYAFPQGWRPAFYEPGHPRRDRGAKRQ